MPSALLRGHRGNVNAVEAQDGFVFASGSDDKTLRIWDIRQSPQRARYCLCECFPAAVDSMTFHPKDQHALYAASGNQILVFDLRSFGASGSIVQRSPLCIIDIYAAEKAEGGACDNEVEINTIRFHPKGEHLAVGDDRGKVVIMERNRAPGVGPAAWKLSKCLSRSMHSSIIGSVAFRPNSSRELVSGGFDCVACSWDFGLGKPLASCNFGAVPDSSRSEDCGSPFHLVNPPFVHALQYISSGRAVLACLGDGTMRAVKASTMATLVSVEAHRGMATCLHVLPGSELASGSACDVAVTGGIDGAIRGWRVLSSTTVPAAMARNKKDAPLELQVDPIFQIEHGCKVNAVAAFPGTAGGELSHVVVADASHNLTLYSDPISQAC